MSRPKAPPSEYLNVRETARLLGVHENTIRNWVRAGTLRSSRVPGSTSHRFERSEVERLQRERGAAASSMAPLLRIESPDLVGPSDLDRWAATEDAKGAFPGLIARLLTATAAVANVEMRSHEGVAAPGWDGSATSAGSSVLPAGDLRFELGTNSNIKSKADDDYAKRIEALHGRLSAEVFVFATPRNWPGGQAWAAERSTQGHFREVRVLDGHTLTLWLQSTPSVHYWLSERLGRTPRDLRTVAAWRSEALDRLQVQLPNAFFLAGRSASTEALLERLQAQQPLVTTIQAGARSEGIAFVHAATSEIPQLTNRIIVAKSAQAWNRVIESSEPLILIPDLDRVDTRIAVDRGHSVVLAAGPSERIPNPNIDLPKIDPHVAAESLRQANHDRSDEYRLVALARRSFPALLRTESSDPRVTDPEWTREPDIASTLSRLALAGVWTQHASDRSLVSTLADATEREIESALVHPETRDDAPFVRSGGLWRVSSPLEMGLLLFRRLGDADKNRWLEAIETVLLEPDPFAGMDTSARLSAQAKGIRRDYSDVLKTGLAEQLALMAGLAAVASPNFPTNSWPQEAVHRLLDAAEQDPTGRTWTHLSSVLPLVAEASPETFLDVVERDLEVAEPMLRLLFQDTDSDFFGTSSPHTGLLWALEGLCWSPDHFERAAITLARLAAIDPGGRLSNRPFESLKNVTLGWVRHSGARAAEKLALMRHLIRALPSLGWRLLIAVWPSIHQTAFIPHAPMYRDWAPGEKGIPWGEWGEFVDGVADLALGHVMEEPQRWVDVIDNAPAMPAKHRQRVREALAGQDVSAWTPEEHFAVWKQLVDEIGRHEEFQGAEWSMSAAELREWRAVADAIGPAGDLRRFAPLFTWRPRLAGIRHDSPDYATAVHAQQSAALEEIMRQGVSAVRDFTTSVKDAWSLGRAIAERSTQWDREVLAWLAEDDESLDRAATALAVCRAAERGTDWVAQALTWPELEADRAQHRLVRAIPADSANWSKVALLGDELEELYWQGLNAYGVETADRPAAVRMLLDKGLPWSALTVLASQVQDGDVPDVHVVKEALNGAATDPSPIPDRTMAGYHVEKLLDYLESVDIEDPEVARLEFLYFRFLVDHRANALYLALGKDPTDFVSLVSAVFRAEGEPPREQSGAESARASIAWDVLHHWPTVPGQDAEGRIDGAHLSAWVATARTELARSGRASIGDEVIGEILSASPTDSDGIWPAREVRVVVESLQSSRIDTGLHIGLRNRRGVTTRGVFDGGDQERALEARYRSMAAIAAAEWPRTARILRGLADAYQAEAREHDAHAERLGDHG